MTAPEAIRDSAVLVVDDSEGSRFVFSSWLRRAGYNVHEAATGAEALETLARVRLDLVLLDVHLPDMTGFEVCEHIKSSRATAAIPVLHVSATATGPDDRSAGLNHGADGYLIEPVERDELLATVTALLRYHDARRTAERLAGRLELLHQTTVLVNAAPTVLDMLPLAAAGTTAMFGTPSIVLVAREGQGRLARAALNEIEPLLASCSPATVLAVADSARRGAVDLGALEPELRGDSRARARGSAITTPRGELVGAIILLTDAITPEDELVLDHLSQALAVAIENQRLYAVEHQIALTLQHAMLPQSVPNPADLEIAVRYQAASDTVEIGGDFYEVIELANRTTLLAIGDVVGHSLRAATVMAELRHSLRAFVSIGLGAAEIIERLDTILAGSHPGTTATVCVAEVDLDANEVRITNAGHIPPLLRRSGATVFVAEHGRLLGLAVPSRWPTVTVPFAEGDLLVLSTDGLVERRDESLDAGLARLAASVASFEGPLVELCDRLLADVGAADGTIDDIAIIAARPRDESATYDVRSPTIRSNASAQEPSSASGGD
jgi:CheY-like chemotaxis protein